jgi:hypothetical protein
MTTRKKKLDLNREDVEVRYSNWLAQLCAIMMPKDLYFIGGRASTKTTNFSAERLQEAVYDLPGAPGAWASDTYANLHKNVISSLQEGLRLLGWEPDIHYVIDKEPPEAWKKKMYNLMSSWKNTMTFFTGFNLTFISLDRPAIGAGRSYVIIFGDEVKYFPEVRIANLLKAVRGYRAKYGNSPLYRSQTFTTDMPDPNRIGEYDWILKMALKNDKKKIIDLIQVGFVYNQVKQEYVSVLETKNAKRILLAERNMKRWEERWIRLRKETSFFWIASSFINVDILSLDWFDDEFAAGLEGIATNILSIIPKLSAASRFYSNLAERHFYSDGNNYEYLDTLPFGSEPDCRILRYLDISAPIEAGLDIGNTLWLVFGQQKGSTYRVLKEIYTLPPNYIREIADEFIRYYQPHKRKVLKLYYDRAANNYKKIGQDVASQIKKAIERDADGKRTGWSVQLMSIGQGNIGSNAEYNFMMELMSGNNKLLPKLLIDRTNCPFLKAQLEKTPAKIATGTRTDGLVVKEKKGDGLPVDRLLRESTNFTDSFKYLLCRKAFLKLINNKRKGTPMSPK